MKKHGDGAGVTRLVVAAASVAALTLALGGCTAGDGSGSAADEFTILSGQTESQPSHQALLLAIDKFEEATGVKVKLVTTAQDQIQTQVESAVLAGQEPDLVNINPVDKVRGWVGDGAAIAVNDYLAEWPEVASEINEGALRQWTVGDDTIGFPYESFQWPLWFNMDLLQSVGITEAPTTMSEFADAVATLHAANILPFATGGSDWTGQDLVQRFIQLYVPEDEYTSVFTDGQYCSNSGAMAALDQLVALRDAGMFAPNAQGLTADDMNTAFYTGQAAMMLAGSWAFANTPAELQPNVAFGGLPVPNGGAVSQPAFAVGYTSSGYVVTPNGAKKADLVREFMKIMYSPEIVQAFIEYGSYIPAVSTVPAFPANTNPMLQASTEAVAVTDRVLPTDPWVPTPVVSTFPQGSSVAFTDGKSAQDVCQAIEAVYAAAQ